MYLIYDKSVIPNQVIAHRSFIDLFFRAATAHLCVYTFGAMSSDPSPADTATVASAAATSANGAHAVAEAAAATAATATAQATGWLSEWFEQANVNWVGLSAIITFYILIFLVGLWASNKIKTGGGNNEEEVMLAGRNIGVLVGVFTMTGTPRDATPCDAVAGTPFSSVESSSVHAQCDVRTVSRVRSARTLSPHTLQFIVEHGTVTASEFSAQLYS